MLTEDIVREKHRMEREIAQLQRSVHEWRQSFTLLSNQEIELATAKVLDRTIENPADRGMRLKFLILSSVMKRRAVGHQVSIFKRFWLLADPQRLIERFMAEALHIPVTFDDEALHLLAQTRVNGES